jgi:purine-binding chemotaxis protein CheW
VAEKLVCFTVGGQELGAPIRAVKETLPERPITRVFLTPQVLAGLTNLRGEVVAVIHLGRLLELPEQLDESGERNIVILRSQRANRAAAGLLVDRMLGVRDVEDDQVLPAPATLAPEPASYLRGLARAPGIDGTPRPLLVLDVEKVLQTERLRPFRRTAS